MTKEVAKINNDFLRNPIPDGSSIGDILRNIHSQGLEPKDYDRIDITVDGQGYMYLWLHGPKTPKSGEGPAKREGTPCGRNDRESGGYEVPEYLEPPQTQTNQVNPVAGPKPANQHGILGNLYATWWP